MIVVDETGFVQPKLFIKVIAPLQLIDEACMITLTTHSDKSEAAYNRILGDYDETARTIYQKFRYSSVCPTCVSRGLKRECPHQAMRAPAWHSERKKFMVDWMMRDNPEDRDREINGLEAGGTGSVFEPAMVESLFVRPRFSRTDVEVPHVFVCIDPNNGPYDSGATEKSDFAVVSGFRNMFGHWVVLGAESISSSRPDQYKDRVIQHIRMARSFNHTRNAKLVVIIENNTMDSQWIAEYISKYGGGDQVMMRERQLKVGVYTDNQAKQKMAQYAREMIGSDALHVSRDFVTTGVESEVLAAMRKQMLTYAERHKLPNDPTGRVIVTFSGKDGAGGKDDLVVALQLMMWWGSQFYTNPKYAPHR